MRFKYVLTMLFVMLLTAGCSVNPTVHSTFNQSIDFNQYKTFGFFQPLDTDSRYESLTSQYLKQAAVNEMTQRGFILSKKDPDLLINFQRVIQDKQQTYEIPISGYSGYSSYRGHLFYDSWAGYRTQTDNYQEGRLNIDIVDRLENKVVWQGNSVGRVDDEQLKNLQSTLQKTVSQVFKQFPMFGAQQ